MNRDKDGYEIVPPLPDPPRGHVCGLCGMRFEAGKAYGFACAKMRCPMGLGPLGFDRITSGGEP